ncbi:MAG TPA: hypothetical protein VF244_10990 [Acidimicrobiales bacterium]
MSDAVPEMVWEEPPPRFRPELARWVPVLMALKQRPNASARLASFDTLDEAAALTTTLRYVAGKLDGTWRITAQVRIEGGAGVWGRFDVPTEATGEPGTALPPLPETHYPPDSTPLDVEPWDDAAKGDRPPLGDPEEVREPWRTPPPPTQGPAVDPETPVGDLPYDWPDTEGAIR